jgi:hypothetical protein
VIYSPFAEARPLAAAVVASPMRAQAGFPGIFAVAAPREDAPGVYIYRWLKGRQFFRRTLERFLRRRIRWWLLRLDHLHLIVSARDTLLIVLLLRRKS